MINSITIKPRDNLRKALKNLYKSGLRCLVVIDDKKILKGTLSDGDVRATIIKGAKLNDKIEGIYNKKPSILFENYNTESAKKILIKKKITILPIVDINKKLINIFYLNKKKRLKKFKHNLPIVLMAGGKGVRMKPFTSILPKPLIPIKGKPVMVRILDQFMKYGADKIFAMINYKSEIIKAFFKEIDYKFNISFIEERKPLGTAGSLYFLKGKKHKNYLITNCDTIINFDPKKFITDHISSKSDITILTSNIDVTIPYGVCLTDNKNNFLGLNEKPKTNYLINIGVYLINRKVLNLITKEKYLDFDELIKLAKKKKYKINTFQVSQKSWKDIGQWELYRSAVKFFNQKDI